MMAERGGKVAGVEGGGCAISHRPVLPGRRRRERRDEQWQGVRSSRAGRSLLACSCCKWTEKQRMETDPHGAPPALASASPSLAVPAEKGGGKEEREREGAGRAGAG